MATLRWTAEAERWLGRIFAYIAKDNTAAAARTVLAIYERTEILRQFPEMGYRYSTHSERHIGILLFGHYRIAYLINSTHVSQAVLFARHIGPLRSRSSPERNLIHEQDPC